ncbi:prepilin-type N-terminal cleavage/methylation domain-containing protein [Serratia rhizosphaerae]|uniref:prepilin-type N-terminal cleavage/methylation domain-containing protein n=1 Tax=Serratia rhizosphaerae TaxID=2597702 RepID=UPI002DBB02D2|nr:prepilin-type N-terminal cleavage/methylation domain-containing protein [Serratia rhizosphaerae]MEB6336684.1 prepilin-type N-terminal cleavage/methylation domain-containing protein [Serratia rhizosphaerae]
MRINGNSGVGRHQRGFSLPEVLIAALLFSVSLLGLLQYHQVLLQGLQRQWQYRQAWSLAHQQLEQLAAGRDADDAMAPGWRRELQYGDIDGACRQVTVTIATPLHQQAQLSRWYCGDD